MSDYNIKVGDEVCVMFDQGANPRGAVVGIVKYCPVATGDCFHIVSTDKQDEGALYYVQQFQFIEVRRRNGQDLRLQR